MTNPPFTRTDSLAETNRHLWRIVMFLVRQIGGSVVLNETEQEEIFNQPDGHDLDKLVVAYDEMRRLIIKVNP